MTRRGVLTASLAAAFFLFPLYPGFIGLTGAPVPGISLLPRALSLALFALVAAIAAYWCVLLFTTRGRPMPTLFPLAALPAAALLSALLGFDPRAGALFIAILVFGLIAHAAILRFAPLPRGLPAILGAYLVSGILAAVLAIALVLVREPAGLYTIGHGRAIGTFVLPGELAGYLVLYVPVAFALTRAKALDLAPLAWTGVVLGALAFIMTFSRAGWVGMAAALAAFAILRRRDRGGVRIALAIGAVAIVVLVLIFNAHHDPSENFTRPAIWAAAMRMAALFPFSGTGPFEFVRLYGRFRTPGGELLAFHAHSVLLTIAAETGIVGVVALLFGWSRFVTALRARLRPSAPHAVVATGIAAGLIGTWVQGLIDTVSIVLFGLWLPFMALALVCAGPEPRPHPAAAGGIPSRRRRVLTAVAVVLLVPCALVQFASSAVFSRMSSRSALPAHLPHQLGIAMYDALTRVVPIPFVDVILTKDALDRRDLHAAETYAARIPAGPLASETRARVAMMEGNEDESTRLYLEAGDNAALQMLVTRREMRSGLRSAYELEMSIRDRLAAARTQPNALAESWWRLAGLAARLGNLSEAATDYAHATAIAPLNTKYLIDAGMLALRRNDPTTAATLFTRASEIDPADRSLYADLATAARAQSRHQR